MRILRPSYALALALVAGSLSFSLVAPTYADVSKQVAAAQSQTVNINSATAEQLAATLKGVGLAKAKAIVEYRTKVGKFVSIDQLVEVKGIGAATVDKNRANITLK